MLSPRVGGGGGYPREFDIVGLYLGRDFKNFFQYHDPGVVDFQLGAFWVYCGRDISLITHETLK